MIRLTKHASARLRQRGLRERDVDLLMRYGTTTRDGLLLERRTVVALIRAMKNKIHDLERLSGVFAVVKGECLVTAYRPGRGKRRRQYEGVR